MIDKNRWIQFVITLSCLLLVTRTSSAQEVQVKPWFLVIVDNSYSMASGISPWGSPNLGVTSCWPSDTGAAYRIHHAKCALGRLVNGVGDAVFGLMNFYISGCNGSVTCDSSANSGMLRVGIAEDNQNTILGFIDNSGTCISSEIVTPGTLAQSTPLAGSLQLARNYFMGTAPSPFNISPTASDLYAKCRPMSVILLTDGDEMCGGTPANVATSLRSTSIPVLNTVDSSGHWTKDIKTYVIGFGQTACYTALDNIATNGGTDAPGSCKAFYANNEQGLSLAFSQIIADSQMIEICNGVDDNCNNVVDEGFNVGTACYAGIGACRGTGAIVCDTTDPARMSTVCNAAANPGAARPENNPLVNCTDGVDNDCDGLIDCVDSDCAGRAICNCIPQTEICDNVDNDCDGEIDEGGLTRSCGSNVGLCTPGTQTCTVGGGGWGACTGTEPVPEICDGLDNDCDGVTDGFTRDCESGNDVGECQPGWQLCTAGVWSACTGAVGPTDEVCDNKDNDCDLEIDEGLTRSCRTDCGQGIETCTAGTWSDCTVGQPSAEICNGIDDDCNGIIDDIPETPYGSSVGECRPGTCRCDPASGQSICEGETGPTEELCDGLDNDCDGQIDEGLHLGDTCGSDVGECKAGRYECVNSKVICVGEIGPTKEICDCLDNDCDGLTDEVADGPLCPGDSICIDCQCALPCGQSAEFKDMCPSGKAAYHQTDNECYCVGERCKADECATQSVEKSGEILCERNGDKVGACVCKNNKCTFPCDGVACPGGLVCDPHDGVCKESSCIIFGCEQGERCDVVLRACEPDPCASAGCAEDQACRDGTCFASCARVTCDSTKRCVDGACAADLCANKTCGAGEACNQATGTCQKNACVGVDCREGTLCDTFSGECAPNPCYKLRCPMGESCQDGACILRCSGGQIECKNACVDPLSSLDYCGAGGDCKGANAGIQCPSGQVCANGACADECPAGQLKCEGTCVDPNSNGDYCGASGDCVEGKVGEKCAGGQACSNGVCSEECGDGMINCDGACIDAQIDMAFCGASGDCSGGRAGRKCASGERCVSGVCAVAGGKKDDAAIGKRTAVVAAGGGGWACTVTPGKAGGGGWAIGLMLIGLLALSRRKTAAYFRRQALLSTLTVTLSRQRDKIAGLGHRISGVAGVFSVLAALAGGVLFFSGCRVNAYCLDCQKAGSGGLPISETGQGGRHGTTGEADGASRPSVDGEVVLPEAGLTDAHTDGDGSQGCATANLDIDPNNCGACGHVCSIEHAFVACVAGQCQLTKCDVGFYDLDQDASNGCEYSCMPSDNDDKICNHKDDDCDGKTDEEIDLQTDPINCGQCGMVCRLPHAADGSACQAGACVLDNTKCDQGFYDIDGKYQTGCEYKCTPADPPSEICNLMDDDCDGMSDENQIADQNQNNVTNSDSRVGQPCGEDRGECNSGQTACVAGAIACIGAVGWTTEVCDGKDNNCNGEIDEGFDAQVDVNNCGGCGNVCSYPNGNAKCQAGQCSLVSCKPGYRDDPSVADQDCLYECDYAGQEICNGRDDDCDKQTDEGLIAPSVSCRTAGVCSGTPVQLACQGTNGWGCDYSGKSGYQAVETICDDVDNDCNGVVDDPYASLKGQPCTVAGTGDAVACHTSGTWKCSGNVLRCVNSGNSPIPPPTVQPEVCNGQDDDCDGSTDEPCTADPINGSGCARDAWVKIPDYTNIYIYAYEASRPDATDTSYGTSSTRACSVAGKMPWTNVTHGQAQTACAAIGGRLCKEAEWAKACQYWSGSGGVCAWSYSENFEGHDCHAYEATTCNGNDYTLGNDRVLPTGSLQYCYREHNSARVYDLSGNVKEWVEARSSGVNPLRGGAMNNTAAGTRCDFNFTLANDSFRFLNAGFRCCYQN